MRLRTLGKTGLAVSPLGFGTFKIGRNEKIKYAQPYDLPDDAAVTRLLDDVAALGINYFDAAPAYGLAEERLGRWLAARDRNRFVTSTKVGERFEHGESRYEFGREAVRASIATSLARLRTDALDLVLIHTSADDVRVLNETPVVETLLEMKRSGAIRAVGLSGKTVEAARQALAWADVLMVEYHVDDRSHAAVMAEAAAAGVGVLVKKALASGRLSPQVALPQVLQTPGVTSIVVGGLSSVHMAENVRIINAAID